MATGDEPEYTTVDFADLAGDADPLSAYGYCELRVQRGHAVRSVRIKIVSVPQDVLTALRKDTPRPPQRAVTDPRTRQRTYEPDPNDPKYVAEMDEHAMRMAREIIGRGVAEALTNPDGTPATTPDQRFAALESKGLTGPQFTELTTAILRLTDWSEEERERRL